MICDGVKTVAAAGTRQALATESTPVSWVQIQALTPNTGAVYIGGKTIAAGRGVELLTGDVLPILPARAPFDLSEIYVDAAVNGEGVSFMYERQV